MGRAVDLDQLAKAPPPLAPLEGPRGLAPLGSPQPQLDLKLAHRLARNLNLVQLVALLPGQGRPEVRVARHQEGADRLSQRLLEPSVRRLPDAAGDQARRPSRTLGGHQALHLPRRESHLPPGLRLRQPTASTTFRRCSARFVNSIISFGIARPLTKGGISKLHKGDITTLG